MIAKYPTIYYMMYNVSQNSNLFKTHHKTIQSSGLIKFLLYTL